VTTTSRDTTQGTYQGRAEDLKPYQTGTDVSGRDISRESGSTQGTQPYSGMGIVRENKSKWEDLNKLDKPLQAFVVSANSLIDIYAVNLALKFGLFERLSQNQDLVPIKEILSTGDFKMDHRKLMDWLDILYVHGFLVREGVLEAARYGISDYTRKYFLKNALDSYVNTYLIHHNLLKRITDLENLLPTGKFVNTREEILKDEQTMRSWEELYYKINRDNFDRLIESVDFSQFKRVMDISGKSGYLCKKIAMKHPNIEVICFDDKRWKPLTDDTQKKFGPFPNNLRFEWGNLLTDKIPEADCIIVPKTFSFLNTDDKKKFEDIIYKSLMKGGKVIVMQNVISDKRDVDDCGLKHSFALFINGFDGYDCSVEEYQKCLVDHGFRDVQVVATLPGDVAVISATK